MGADHANRSAERHRQGFGHCDAGGTQTDDLRRGQATVARLHRGIAKGARGAAIGDLTVTQAASGKLSGSVDLTAEQVEALKQGKLYVQLHTAKGVAPDGSTLWGWLLK